MMNLYIILGYAFVVGDTAVSWYGMENLGVSHIPTVIISMCIFSLQINSGLLLLKGMTLADLLNGETMKLPMFFFYLVDITANIYGFGLLDFIDPVNSGFLSGFAGFTGMFALSFLLAFSSNGFFRAAYLAAR